MAKEEFPGWHGTTIIGVRKGGQVVIHYYSDDDLNAIYDVLVG